MRNGWIWILVALALGPAAATNAQQTKVNEYVIGIEDVLGLVVWGEPELTLDLQVRPDGKITVPLLNDIHVAGQTPVQLAATITKNLQTYVKGPASPSSCARSTASGSISSVRSRTRDRCNSTVPRVSFRQSPPPAD